MTEQDLSNLLQRMTLPEKIGQMYSAHAPTDENLKMVEEGRLGTLLNIGHWNEGGLAARCNRFQRVAVEKSRLGIPLLFGRDVIHGYRTTLPIPLGQAASFDEALVEEGAAAAAREARAHGQNWTFAPMVDVSRDPRWGRIAESCGEEPEMNARMGAAMVRGFQGAGMASCAKHYAGYGAAEAGRDYNTTWIPENHLRNVYLPPFEACVKAGVKTVMSAFNDLNGVPTSGNALTIRQILKGEWGFNGLVVSDWGAVDELITHGYAADGAEAALRAIRAGVDMEMVTIQYETHVEKLLASGALTMALVDDAVMRVLRVKNELGLFENPYVPEGVEDENANTAATRAIARRAAEESCVLLKNDGLLPLANVKRLAVIGPLADAPEEQVGCWSMDAEYATVVTPLAALRETFDGDISYFPALKTSRDTDESQFAEAVAAAEKADATVMFLGEEALLSGEAHCRAYLDFPGAQTQLLEAVAKKAKRLCVVVMAGRPLIMGRVAELANAILYAWHPGNMGGGAVADLLLGRAVPSGKLPVSFPHCEGQIPVYMGRRNTGRPTPEGARVGVPPGTPLDPKGFTSTYMDCDVNPFYEFGFGLSYTTFEYADLELSRARVSAGGSLAASVTLRNAGNCDATEVVQLYIRDHAASVTRPLKELKDFKRVFLKAGESCRVTFELTTGQLEFYNAENRLALEPGAFTLFIGGASPSCLSAAFAVV